MVWGCFRPHRLTSGAFDPEGGTVAIHSMCHIPFLKHNSLRGRGEITRTVRRSLAGSLRAERWLAAWLVESAGGLVRIGHLISRLR